MAKVSQEIARQDINKWLDYKKISPKRRDELKENIDKLVDNVSEGVLIVTDKFELTQDLLFPLGIDGAIKKLTYKPRLKQIDISKKIQGNKGTDVGTYVRSYVCALTDQPAGIIGELDSEDYNIANSIAVFFI